MIGCESSWVRKIKTEINTECLIFVWTCVYILSFCDCIVSVLSYISLVNTTCWFVKYLSHDLYWSKHGELLSLFETHGYCSGMSLVYLVLIAGRNLYNLPNYFSIVVITFGLLRSVVFLWFVTNVWGLHIRPIFSIQWVLQYFFLLGTEA